jgi:hypothetical protein
MNEVIDLSALLTPLVDVAYPELSENHITIGWGRISSFATISWNQKLEDIRIKCSHETKKWHEAPLIGLLAHELSHPVHKGRSESEESTDLDVIERGLGTYLGVERLFTGKYEDHIIRKGRDRYLGYRSIRNQLSETELKHLDILLKQLRLIPHQMIARSPRQHDIIIVNSSTNTIIEINGYRFELPFIDNPNVKIVESESSTHVLVNGEDIGII